MRFAVAFLVALGMGVQGFADNCGESCGSDCGACSSWLETCPGLTFMAEGVALRYQDTFSDSGFNRFNTGSRFTLGYMGDRGRELRVRGFELGFRSPFDNFIQMNTIDAEIAGRFQLFNWDGELSLGARWAQWHEAASGAFGGLNFQDSYGPVIGVHIRTDIVDWLDVYATGRYSQQFGHPQGLTLGTFSITEVQLGLEAKRDLGSAIGFARLGVEAQNWTVNTDTSDEDAGLFGGVFAIGFTR